MDYTVHGILQARILEWAAFPFSRGSSQPRGGTRVSHMVGGLFTSRATREAPFYCVSLSNLCFSCSPVPATGLSRVGRSAFLALCALSLTDCTACFCLTGCGRLVRSGPCTPAAPEHLSLGLPLGTTFALGL